MKRLIVLLCVALGGCAFLAREVVPAVDFAACAWATYQAEPQGTPMSKVINDVAAKCGPGDLVKVLDKHEPAAKHTFSAHRP